MQLDSVCLGREQLSRQWNKRTLYPGAVKAGKSVWGFLSLSCHSGWVRCIVTFPSCISLSCASILFTLAFIHTQKPCASLVSLHFLSLCIYTVFILVFPTMHLWDCKGPAISRLILTHIALSAPLELENIKALLDLYFVQQF